MYTIFLIISLLFFHFVSQPPNKQHLRIISIGNKITLDPSMVINETTYGDAAHLLDEQELSGDPANGTGGIPKSGWFPEWVKRENFPVSAIIDLGYQHNISKIYLFYPKGQGYVSVSIGKPFEWRSIVKEDLTRYNTWKSFEISDTTRYIHITTKNINAPSEILLYGESLMPEKPKLTSNSVTKQPPFDQYIGINAFIDDPMERMEVAGFVREYQPWQWNEPQQLNGGNYKSNKIKWNPSYAGGNSWYFDKYFKSLNEREITVVPCIQRNVKWLNGVEGKPMPPEADPLDPLSYSAHSFYLYQFAARYGSQKIPEEELALAEGQPKESGLNLIKYIEDWNEQDNFWSSRRNYFTPYEYAAMASADYDGHLNELGKGHGIKNADSSIKMVMGGIAELNLDYVKCIKFWADHHRAGDMPFDVLNFHHYSHTKEPQKTGISPEEDRLFEKMQKLVSYRNKNFSEMEVWMTEFGYDTHPESPQRAPKIADFSQEEVQAQWIVRSYLIMYAAGIDRAVQYMLRDVKGAGATQYSTSGLVSSKQTGWKPKPSWYYVYTLKTWLKGMQFDSDLSTDKVKIYKFDKAGKVAYVIWSPTSNGESIKNFSLSIKENSPKATFIQFKDGEKQGIVSALDISNKTIRNLTITETPLIIICDSIS